MEILRAVKNNEPFSSNLAGGVMNLLEIQLVVLFIVNHSFPIYNTLDGTCWRKTVMQSTILKKNIKVQKCIQMIDIKV